MLDLPPSTSTAPTHSSLTADSRLVRAAAAAKWAGVSRATFYAWRAAGRIPPGRRLSPGVVVYDLTELAAALSTPEAA